MLPKTNKLEKSKFALLTRYDLSYFMYLHDENSDLYISNPIENKQLLRSVFFIIALQHNMTNRLAEMHPSLLGFLPGLKEKIIESLSPPSRMVLRPKVNLNDYNDLDSNFKSRRIDKPGSAYKSAGNSRNLSSDKNKRQQSFNIT